MSMSVYSLIYTKHLTLQFHLLDRLDNCTAYNNINIHASILYLTNTAHKYISGTSPINTQSKSMNTSYSCKDLIYKVLTDMCVW